MAGWSCGEPGCWCWVRGVLAADAAGVWHRNGDHAVGSNSPDEGGTVWPAADSLAALVLFSLPNLTPLYVFVGVDVAAIPITEDYLSAASLGVVPAMFYLRATCARDHDGAWHDFWRTVAEGPSELLVHPWWVACWLWVVMWMVIGDCFRHQFVAMLGTVRFSRVRKVGLTAAGAELVEIKRLIGLVPIGLTTFFEFSVFSARRCLLADWVLMAAAHQIASNVGALTFMIPMALGMAVSIRVGFNVGAEDFVASTQRLSPWSLHSGLR